MASQCMPGGDLTGAPTLTLMARNMYDRHTSYPLERKLGASWITGLTINVDLKRV